MGYNDEKDSSAVVEPIEGERSGQIEARLDLGRERRTGIPEILLAEVKTDEQVVAIVRSFLERRGHAVVSRLRAETLERLTREFDGYEVDVRPLARAAAIHAPGYRRPHTGGQIGILTAGTGD
ncbi:MAG: hypothetical protein ACRDHP_20110, partial [Ktedonobacterales bacterium]